MSVQLPTVEDINEVRAEVKRLALMLEHMSMNLGIKQTVTVAEICKLEGVSKSQIWGKEAYLLPNFGKSEYPDGITRWEWTTYLNWREIPVAERKGMYEQHLKEVRRRVTA